MVDQRRERREKACAKKAGRKKERKKERQERKEGRKLTVWLRTEILAMRRHRVRARAWQNAAQSP